MDLEKMRTPGDPTPADVALMTGDLRRIPSAVAA
jgi:hypothetical protein